MSAEKRSKIGMAFDTGKHKALTNNVSIDMAMTAMGSMVSNPAER